MVVAAVLATIKLPDHIMAAAIARPTPIIVFLFIDDAIKMCSAAKLMYKYGCNLQLIMLCTTLLTGETYFAHTYIRI